MDAATLYGAPPPATPSGTAAPDRVDRTTQTTDDDKGDPIAVLVMLVAVAVALGWLSIRVEVG